MQKNALSGKIVGKSLKALLPFLGFFYAHSHALEPLSDSDMASIKGQGLAIALDDFRYETAPTSFLEVVGSEPNQAAIDAGWHRGDARYYSLHMTGEGAGTDWFGHGCTDDLCPIGNAAIANFAPVYNPFVMRVFQYEGYDYQGNLLTGTSRPTILETIGPTASDTWRWSFWGEMEVARGSACPDTGGNTAYCGLQSQTVILGKPITTAGDPAIFRLMQTANADDPTFGFTYQSALSGDFRFSVNQTGDSPDALHTVPDFSDGKGLTFRNVDAFLPLGRLHSQAITLDSADSSGNFSIELTAMPNVEAVYTDIYCGNRVGTDGPCATQLESEDFFGNTVTAIISPNPETHGYVRWGDFSVTPPTSTATDNGIYFTDPGGSVTNIGVARLEGILIQHMKLTTQGAGS